jgi:branched-subunit amino acid ABC-type transport system permease component
MDAVTFAQYVANGVVFGAILALCAIGLTLIYGILNLSSFAHGDTLTFGAYMTLFFGAGVYAGRQDLLLWGGGAALALGAIAGGDLAWPRRLTRHERAALGGFAAILALATVAAAVSGVGGGDTTDTILVLALLLSIVATVALTVGFEFVLWRPLRRKRATVLSLVIASLGLSLVLRNALQQFFGGDYQSLARPVVESETYFGVRVSDAQWITLALTLALIAGVHVFLTRSRTGKAMRALADNRDLARVCGIDVDRVIVYVWVLAAALVAIAGVLLALNQNNNVNINMGFGIIIPIFAAVLLGGVGSPYGAMMGGLVVGVAMKLAPAKYDLAVAFLVLAATLLVRPQGILGRKA